MTKLERYERKLETIDVKAKEEPGPINFSKWQVGYFRVYESDTSVLELCLIPWDTSITGGKYDHGKGNRGELYKVPKEQHIIRLRSGDPWPLGLPICKFWDADMSDDLARQWNREGAPAKPGMQNVTSQTPRLSD